MAIIEKVISMLAAHLYEKRDMQFYLFLIAKSFQTGSLSVGNKLLGRIEAKGIKCCFVFLFNETFLSEEAFLIKKEVILTAMLNPRHSCFLLGLESPNTARHCGRSDLGNIKGWT